MLYISSFLVLILFSLFMYKTSLSLVCIHLLIILSNSSPLVLFNIPSSIIFFYIILNFLESSSISLRLPFLPFIAGVFISLSASN